MSKRVVFYDKGTGGHRLPIQTVIKEWLKPGKYTFDVIANSEPHNAFTFLRELAQRDRLDHCHLMTLRDCLEDYAAARDDVRWLERAGVSLSGTYYRFTRFSPHLDIVKALLTHPHYAVYGFFRYGVPLRPAAAVEFKALARIVRWNAVKAVTIPDERLSDKLRYPFWRDKLRYLPDPATFSSDPCDHSNARKHFDWDDRLPTVLMFGSMREWKGLAVLLEALTDAYSHLYKRAFRVVLAGRQIDRRPEIRLSPAVELVELDHYIEDDMAKRLFAAVDCVVMPYRKSFEWSSGTFSLACASGKFVIVSDSGLMAWRVRKLSNGLVYEADRPSALAMALSRFVEAFQDISYPVSGSLEYAATCRPDRYVRILDEIVTGSMRDTG